MSEKNKPDQVVDWNLTTWEGARREALRRWAQLPLERIIAALEEMQELNNMFAAPGKMEELAGSMRYTVGAKTMEEMEQAIRLGANQVRDDADDK